MKYYNFIKDLREHDLPANYEAMFARIKQQASKRLADRNLKLLGALAVVLVAVGIYFGLSRPGTDASIMNYVFDQEKINDSPIISYVFDGTL
jgi:hypothetical protein